MKGSLKMLNRRYLVTVVFAAVVVFQGCSHITLLRTEELREVQSRVDSLHNNMSQTQRELMQEQKANSEMLRLMRADQQIRFNQIERQVSAIENNISENLLRLAQIDQKTSEFSRRLEEKLSADSLETVSRRREIEHLFKLARSDFDAGRYDLAISGFEDIIGQFPETEEAIKSKYWIAESHYAKRDFETAEQVYLDFIRSHADRPEICVAFYKLGLSYEHQNKMKSREMVWRRMLKHCPDSQEAKIVENLLDDE